MSHREPHLLEPKDDESDADYRARLRAWVDAIPRDPDETDSGRRSQWELLCNLVGITPD